MRVAAKNLVSQLLEPPGWDIEYAAEPRYCNSVRTFLLSRKNHGPDQIEPLSNIRIPKQQKKSDKVR